MKRTSSMVASVLSLASLVAWAGCAVDTTAPNEEASGEAQSALVTIDDQASVEGEADAEEPPGQAKKVHFWKQLGVFTGGANGLQQIRVTGDENGDGTDDLVVGQPSYLPPGGAAQGRVVVISGNDASLIKVIPSEAVETFGYSVAALGDVNGDGRNDYGVGSPVFFDALGRNEAGRTWILRSNATGGYDRSVVTGEERVGGFFGRAVAFLGGGDPILASARAKFFGGRVVGLSLQDDSIAYVGSEDPVNNDAVSERRGYSIWAIGDLDGDGTREVAMAAAGQDPNNAVFPWPYAGRVYIHNGATGELIRAIEGPAADRHFGNAVSEIGDVDGDGVNDYVVGAFYSRQNNRNLAGSAHVISGAAVRDGSQGKLLSLTDHPEAIIRVHRGTTSTALLGMSTAALWDLDGDGVSEYAVSAPGVNVNGKGFAGRVYVYSGATGEVHSTFDGDGAGVWLGEELESNTGAERRFFISTWNADGNAGRIYVHRWK